MKKEITFCEFCHRPITEDQKFIIVEIEETGYTELVHQTCFIERAYDLDPNEVEIKIEKAN